MFKSEVLDRNAILRNLSCAGHARGRLCFTNVGALFFRTKDEDAVFRHAGIVCALFKGTDKAYILDAKELNGDIVSNIDDAVLFLKKHLRLSFKIKTLRRENILELPEDALHEAIVNAVCHRDYFESGARVMVEVYDDRVDVVSPGGACKGVTKDNFGTVSITRNSLLASMLYRIDYIEQMGTGVMRMKKAAREAEVPEPEFALSDFFKVTFRRNEPQSLASTEQKSGKRLKPVATESPNRLASDRKLEIVAYLQNNKQASITDASKLLHLSKSRARAILRGMIADGTIEKVGNNRYAYYVLK